MKNFRLFLLASVFTGLISCSEKEKSVSETKTPITTPTAVSAEGSISSDGLNEPLPSVPVSASQTSSSSPNLNPAHGEPGHRCDIAVGAPLNSAPSQGTSVSAQTAPTTAPNPTVLTAPAPAATGTGSGKINPAHGEPGHVCSKPVGQPL